jgi:hypothetical protein
VDRVAAFPRGTTDVWRVHVVVIHRYFLRVVSASTVRIKQNRPMNPRAGLHKLFRGNKWRWDMSDQRKSISAKCGHVTRRLRRKERLTGKVLDFAIEVAGEGTDIADKLAAGVSLSDYELHLLLDVYLLHCRLRA